MARPSLALGFTALGLMATVAAAQEASAFKFSGFGSLAATRSSEDKADFYSNFAMPNGPGYSRSTDLKGDSRVGLQGDLRMGDYFSAVVQVVSEHRYDDSFKPYLNIASLKLQAMPGLAFRVGRIPYSAYLISDFAKVGYAQPWVRPPVEVYQFNPLTAVDGADISWQFNAGEVAFSGQFLGGTSNAKISPSLLAVAATPAGQETPASEWKGDNFLGASVAINYGSTTFRVFHGQMKGTFNDLGFDGPVGPFGGMGPFTALRVLPPAFGGNPALADQYQIRKDKLIYQSAAFNYDPGSWFLMVEATRKSGDENMFLHFTSGYATLGVRLGTWTPYATYGWKHTTSPTTNANPIINGLLANLDRAQTSYSGGLRWDFYKNLALKLQYDHVTNATGSYGALTNSQPGFKTGESYNLSTVSLDFVF
ncbi:MAG TPA: hypothetical protein VJ486_02085 [Geothrix sp.]|nr:hypothetical protein [Geothrix sp.]